MTNTNPNFLILGKLYKTNVRLSSVNDKFFSIIPSNSHIMVIDINLNLEPFYAINEHDSFRVLHNTKIITLALIKSNTIRVLTPIYE